eukprot:31702-Chlamydomonas_euryale.AAC.1
MFRVPMHTIVKGAGLDTCDVTTLLEKSTASWETMLWHAHAATSWTRAYCAPEMRILRSLMTRL